MPPFRKSLEQVIGDNLSTISNAVTRLCGQLLNDRTTQGDLHTGTVFNNSTTWTGSSATGYRKLLVDLDKCITFTVEVTLSDGSTWTHRANNKSSYVLELTNNQADIVEVTVTELSSIGAEVAINLLTI